MVWALERGADPRAVSDEDNATLEGVTALIQAAAHGNEEAVELLLPLSDPIARDKNGLTALMWAAEWDHFECVALLLDRGGPLEADPEGMSALALAARKGQEASVALLLPVSDLARRDASGRVAGDWAEDGPCRALFLAFKEARDLSASVARAQPSRRPAL